jgi:GxxExxY protein
MALIKAELTEKIIGACMEVHNNLGNGFLEAVYQEALEREFVERCISYEREKELQIFYKGKPLDKKYYADFVCFDEIIVEIKAVSNDVEIYYSQLFNYLVAAKLKVGMMFNFGNPSLQWKRIVL